MSKFTRYLATLFFTTFQVHANPIFYEVVSPDTGNRYEYRYTVVNETNDPIDWFTIYFDLGLYENLSITANPDPNWDGIIGVLDPLLPDDGFADWLSFGAPISKGESLSGFSVGFDWLGTGTPREQRFEINDSSSSELVVVTSSGDTRPLSPPSQVPAPPTLVLLLLGLGMLLVLVGRERCFLRMGYKAAAVHSAALVVLVGVAPLTLPSPAHAGTEDLSVVGRDLVSSQRVGRTHFDYTFTVSVNNAGSALSEVEATLSSNSPYTEIIDSNVALGDLASGTTKSTDTYTFRHNRRVPFDPEALVWSFSAAPPAVQNPPNIISSPPTRGSVGLSYTYDLEASDPDAGDTLTYSLRSAPTGMAIDPATGEIRWTPSSSGPADVDVEVKDTSGLGDRQIFLIRVDSGLNDAPPTLQPVNNQVVVAGETLNIQVSATDPEGEAVRYGLGAAPSGMIIDPATGQISWTPDTGPFGAFSATVTASDPGGQSDQTSFAVDVLSLAATNQPPQLAPLSDVTAVVGMSVTVKLQASDGDPNDILSFSLSGLPSGASFDANRAVLNWLPDDRDIGGTRLTATVTDSAGQSDTKSFWIVVEAPQAPPVARDDAYTLRGDRTQSIDAPGVLANDSDPNGDRLTAVKISDPDLGSLDTFNGDGAFVYTPPEPSVGGIELTEECTTPLRRRQPPFCW